MKDRVRTMLEQATYTIDDELWERLNELTGGASALCYQCGVCTAACPWGLVRQEALSVRSILRQAQLGLQYGGDGLWLCTTCAQCQAYCPRGVNGSEIFRSLRLLAWERRAVENGLPSLLWSLYWNGNPWSQPPSTRSAWSKGLDVPQFDAEQHELLLYVGCTSSFDRRAQKIVRALVAILNRAGVSYGFLGNEEPCCGEAALSLGHKTYFEEIAQETTRFFQKRGVRKLVAISPHCYDVFKNHYPGVGRDEISPRDAISSYHYTQYLAGLLEQGRLDFSPAVEQVRITFQDPCYLGRHNGEYEAPRRLLAAIPGVELVEMENSRVDGLCCGGGGGRTWLETAPGERFSDLRVVEAQRSGASILATACPFCILCLEDSRNAQHIPDLAVLDIAEILASALPDRLSA
jgi:Fe-S oxidoreductase